MTRFIAYIGHGRALEFFLGWYKLVLATSIMISGLSPRVPALADLTWYYPRYILASPFLLIGTIQIVGLILNARGIEWSWIFRFIGASLAMLVWSTLLIKSATIGQPTLLIPLAVCCLPASGFLVYKSWNRLPPPGAAGLV